MHNFMKILLTPKNEANILDNSKGLTINKASEESPCTIAKAARTSMMMFIEV